MSDSTKGGLAVAFIVALIVGGSILAFGSWGTVPAGHRGVVLNMGAVSGEVKGEGFYWKTPLVETVHDIAVQTQKLEITGEGASKDLQTISAEVALNYSVDPGQAAALYQDVGMNYQNVLIVPAVQEAVKGVTARYDAVNLIALRNEVRQAMETQLKERLEPRGFRIEALNIVDFDFSKSFNEAIEAKVTAEQNALAAKNLLEQKKYEAQQAIETAKGKAEAMAIESKALSENMQVLQLRALEKWNGVLPTFLGGGAPVPFVDIKAIQGAR